MNLEKVLRVGSLVLAALLALMIALIGGAEAVTRLVRGLAASDRVEQSASEREGTFPERADFGEGRERLADRVLRESFGCVSLEEAVILVGLLHHRRIIPSGETPLRFAVEGPLARNPLELREAVATVSFLFHWNRDLLRAGYREHWAPLREGPLARSLERRLTAHPWVRRLEEYPDFPGAV